MTIRQIALSVLVFVAGLVSGEVRAEALRFECTSRGLERESRIADVVAIVTINDLSPDAAVPVKVDIESATFSKKRLLLGYRPVISENNLKFVGTYSLAPRQYNKADRKGRDLVLTPDASQQTAIRELYLSTLPLASYAIHKNGETFATDCVLNPM